MATVRVIIPIGSFPPPEVRHALLFEPILKSCYAVKQVSHKAFHMNAKRNSPVIVSDKGPEIACPDYDDAYGCHLRQDLCELPDINIVTIQRCGMLTRVMGCEEPKISFKKGTQQKARAEATMARMGTIRRLVRPSQASGRMYHFC